MGTRTIAINVIRVANAWNYHSKTAKRSAIREILKNALRLIMVKTSFNKRKLLFKKKASSCRAVHTAPHRLQQNWCIYVVVCLSCVHTVAYSSILIFLRDIFVCVIFL